ncbi:hypothetical protein BDV3_000705 [Batrachochytrium dendrobatidis]
MPVVADFASEVSPVRHRSRKSNPNRSIQRISTGAQPALSSNNIGMGAFQTNNSISTHIGIETHWGAPSHGGLPISPPPSSSSSASSSASQPSSLAYKFMPSNRVSPQGVIKLDVYAAFLDNPAALLYDRSNHALEANTRSIPDTNHCVLDTIGAGMKTTSTATSHSVRSIKCIATDNRRSKVAKLLRRGGPTAIHTSRLSSTLKAISPKTPIGHTGIAKHGGTLSCIPMRQSASAGYTCASPASLPCTGEPHTWQRFKLQRLLSQPTNNEQSSTRIADTVYPTSDAKPLHIQNAHDISIQSTTTSSNPQTGSLAVATRVARVSLPIITMPLAKRRDSNPSSQDQPWFYTNPTLATMSDGNLTPTTLNGSQSDFGTEHGGVYRSTKQSRKGGRRCVINKDPIQWSKSAPLDISPTAVGYNLLKPEEITTCSVLRLQPDTYLRIKDIMLTARVNQGVFKKREAQRWCRIDVNKTARIYDWFVRLGWLDAPDS